MGKELDFIQTMLESQAERIESLARGVAEVSSHCATLVERTSHLASREDLSTAIRLHTVDCKASRAPARASNGNGGNGSMRRLIKALAALLAVAAAAVSAYLGFSPP